MTTKHIALAAALACITTSAQAQEGKLDPDEGAGYRRETRQRTLAKMLHALVLTIVFGSIAMAEPLP